MESKPKKKEFDVIEKEFDVIEFRKKLDRDLKIDSYNLKEELERQPNLFMYYSIGMSGAIKRKEMFRGELIDEIVDNPSDFGIEGKVTDAGINRVVDSTKNYIEITYQVACWSSAVKSLEHKKKSLEYDCQLLIGGFFSEPNVKKPIKKKGD